MNIALEYIKYRLNAKGRHGIHSPFVYGLVDKCMQIHISSEDEATLKKVKKSFNDDSRIIEVEDFGAGSKKMGSKRTVKQLFKTSSSNGKFGRFFYQLSNFYQPKNSLEFGTSIGIGSVHFAIGSPSSNVTTIEACKETYSIATANFRANQLKNIESIHSTFNDYLDSKPSQQFDLIFIDGHHDGTALLDYLERLQPNYHDQTIILVDDIRWSDSMFEAWNKLVSSNQFNVSIDFFRMGMLVPRSGQMKEHFVLKM